MPPFQKMNQGHKAILASGAVASYYAQGGGGGGRMLISNLPTI